MEYTTMIAEMSVYEMGMMPKVKNLQIGQDAVSILGRSIEQCLDDMRAEGWNVISGKVRPTAQGVICCYEYERLS